MFFELFKPKNNIVKHGSTDVVARAHQEYIHGEKRLDGMLTQVMPIRDFKDKLLYIIRGYPNVKVPRCSDDGIDFNAAKKVLEVINMVQHIPHIYGYIGHHKSYLSGYGQLILMWHSIVNGKRMQMTLAFNSMFMRLYQNDLVTGEADYRNYDVMSQTNITDFMADEYIGKKFYPIPYVHPELTRLISNSHLENAIINSLLMVPRVRNISSQYEALYQYYFNSGDIIIKVIDNGYVMLASPWMDEFITMPYWNKETMQLLDQIGNTLKSQEYYVL